MTEQATPKVGLMKALRATPEMKKQFRNEVLGFGVGGTIFSAAIGIGLLYAVSGISLHGTDLINSGLHLISSNVNLPNFVGNAVEAAGKWVNSLPHASVLPHLATQHLSGISNDQNFWGVAEGLTSVAAGGKAAILVSEVGKRRVAHAKKLMAKTIYEVPVVGPLLHISDSTAGLIKVGEFAVKLTEVSSIFTGAPYGVNDLFGLSSILFGYRLKDGILKPKDMVGMSALLLTPYAPTLTVYDLLKGAHKHGKSAISHVDNMSTAARRLTPKK